MTNNIQIQRRSTDHLAMLRDINEFIFDLALGLTEHDRKFANKLRQVLGAHIAELQRMDSDDTGDTAYFARIDILHLMAALLSLQHIDRLSAKRTNHEPWTKEDRRTTRSLNAALKDFAEGQRDFLQRFDPPETNNLAKSIWFNFYDVSNVEAEADAAAIKAYFVKACNAHTAEKTA
jgi:hypothetical protein